MSKARAGWVCYAEKTHGDVVLPHISTARSPQAVAGALVKRLLDRRRLTSVRGGEVAPTKVYHVAVMPCYDKKLEAARSDFADVGDAAGHSSGGSVGVATPADAVGETDSVLTTGEVEAMLQEDGVLLADAPPSPLDAWLPEVAAGSSGNSSGGDAALPGVRGSSGGYLEHAVKYAAREVYGRVRLPTHIADGHPQFP